MFVSKRTISLYCDFLKLDIDECAGGTHRCDHICTNTDSSYICSCHEGHTLSDNGHSCEGKQIE